MATGMGFMEGEVRENLDRYLGALEKRLSQEGVFEEILKQIERHIEELRELKSSGHHHLACEVADLLLLSRALAELENVPDRVVGDRSRKFVEKVRGIYGLE